MIRASSQRKDWQRKPHYRDLQAPRETQVHRVLWRGRRAAIYWGVDGLVLGTEVAKAADSALPRGSLWSLTARSSGLSRSRISLGAVEPTVHSGQHRCNAPPRCVAPDEYGTAPPGALVVGWAVAVQHPLGKQAGWLLPLLAHEPERPRGWGLAALGTTAGGQARGCRAGPGYLIPATSSVKSP